MTQEKVEKKYIEAQVRPDRVEAGHYYVKGNQLIVELVPDCGGATLKTWISPDEDQARAARQLMKQNYSERGGDFYGPLRYPSTGNLV
jgi:hypothetical protein